MAKIATVCEDSKVDKFKEVFDARGITYTTEKNTGFPITLFVCESEQDIIKPIVDEVTQFFIDKQKEKLKLHVENRFREICIAARIEWGNNKFLEYQSIYFRGALFTFEAFGQYPQAPPIWTIGITSGRPIIDEYKL